MSEKNDLIYRLKDWHKKYRRVFPIVSEKEANLKDLEGLLVGVSLVFQDLTKYLESE